MEEMETEITKPHIFLSSPHMSAEGYEQQYINEAFDTNWIAPLGPNVNGFEQEMTQRVGAGDAAALSSGTAAIHLALKLAGVGPGDLVFCSSLTFSATANPILYLGAKPVFIDSDFDTWNMSPAALKRAFDTYEALGVTPGAVIFVHLYGIAADLDGLLSVCREHHCPVIEDAAESLGTRYRGSITGGAFRDTGTFGDYGILSFNGNKIITSSGGGMLLCNTPDAKEKAKKARFWATQSRDAVRWYQHSEVGYNYRMSNIAAGIGRGQLKVLDKRVEKKRWIFAYYREHLKDLAGVSFMPALAEAAYSNCWLTSIRLNEDGEVKPLDVMLALEADDVESRPIWKPLHLQPVFAGCGFVSAVLEEEKLRIADSETGADESVSGRIFKSGVCLPSDSKLEEADLERICGVIRGLWEEK